MESKNVHFLSVLAEHGRNSPVFLHTTTICMLLSDTDLSVVVFHNTGAFDPCCRTRVSLVGVAGVRRLARSPKDGAAGGAASRGRSSGQLGAVYKGSGWQAAGGSGRQRVAGRRIPADDDKYRQVSTNNDGRRQFRMYINE